MNKKRILGALVLSFGAMFLAIASPANEVYEAYYSYLGSYPSDAEPGWHEEAQGLAHDHDNWFITQRWALWKIHVTCDLKSAGIGDQGVSAKYLYMPSLVPPYQLPADMPELYNQGYNHLGDPEHFEGYVFVPVEGGPDPAIAVFRGSDLAYLSHACLPEQDKASWCAVDPQGNLYSSNSDGVTKVYKYSVNRDDLKNHGKLTLTKIEPSITLLGEQGNSITLNAVQGGVISPSGELLYIVADGIHVFDLSNGTRVRRSTNTNDHGDFSYQFKRVYFEEPEGLTIWDLDTDGRAPCSGEGPCVNRRLRGQLHVLLLDNDYTPGFNDDSIYLKHYTETIYVADTYSGEEKGTPNQPFKTVSKANNKAWGGAQIKIRTGTYLEALTFTKRIRVLAENGTSTIGR